MRRWVVSAVKLGATSLIRNDISFSLLCMRRKRRRPCAVWCRGALREGGLYCTVQPANEASIPVKLEYAVQWDLHGAQRAPRAPIAAPSEADCAIGLGCS